MEERTAAGVAPQRPRRRPRAIVLVQVVLALGLVGASWYALKSSLAEPVMVAPSHIGDMDRVSLVTGDQAIGQITKLHGTDVGVVDGYLAEYQKGSEHMTVWVGLAASELDAEQLMQRMTAGISQGGTGFSVPLLATMFGEEVFSTQGGGGTNYYFRASHSVVWVTLMGSPMPATRLKDVLDTIRFE